MHVAGPRCLQRVLWLLLRGCGPGWPQVAGAEKPRGLPEGSPSSRDKVLQPQNEVGFQTSGVHILGKSWLGTSPTLRPLQGLGVGTRRAQLGAARDQLFHRASDPPAGSSDLCPVLESDLGQSGFPGACDRKRGQGQPQMLTQSPRLKGGAGASVGACSWRKDQELSAPRPLRGPNPPADYSPPGCKVSVFSPQ